MSRIPTMAAWAGMLGVLLGNIGLVYGQLQMQNDAGVGIGALTYAISGVIAGIIIGCAIGLYWGRP